VYQGFTIPPFYDSMIAKLITYAEDRKRCIDRTKRALWEFQIAGVKNNIPFHEIVMKNDKWIKGEYDTSFISRYKILDQVINYVKEKKTISSTQKTAAAMAAVQSVIIASNK
jgi:acetyl/propionyl-CoA carboxylase alpha subunit